jgi:amphi-Trp domain-containing protein
VVEPVAAKAGGAPCRPDMEEVEVSVKDLKFEQKGSLTRIEAADQLSALAAALRHGGHAELDLGPGTLGLRIPDDMRTELEVEVSDGHIEVEIELKWPTAQADAPESVVAESP